MAPRNLGKAKSRAKNKRKSSATVTDVKNAPKENKRKDRAPKEFGNATPENKRKRKDKAPKEDSQITPTVCESEQILPLDINQSTSTGQVSMNTNMNVQGNTGQVSINTNMNVQGNTGNIIGSQIRNDGCIETLNIFNNIIESAEQESTLSSEKNDQTIRIYLLNQQKKMCRTANKFTPAILTTRFDVDIAHMFTDLTLLKESKKKQGSKPTSLDEVLGIIKSTPACKALLDGEGGIGKSTLLRHLAYRWATEDSDETFKGKIVFLFNIRDIDKDETILDAIVRTMKLNDFSLKTNLPNDSKLIKIFLMNHDDEIVLLLDGLDELRDENESPISIFKREELENSKVILTCRSEKIIDEFIKESSVHINVKGFSKINIRRYIKSYFKYYENPSLGKTLIKRMNLDYKPVERSGLDSYLMELSQHYSDDETVWELEDEVYSMCRNPLLLLSICIIWEEKGDLPVDRTELFKSIYRSILNQYIEKHDTSKGKISKFEDTPKKYVNAMLLLGKCMYESLKRNRLDINKKQLERNKDIATLALKLGFVYKDPPHSKGDFQEIYTSPHKLIVESMVGFYLYKLCVCEGSKNSCNEDTKHLLTPLDDNEWEAIRTNMYLRMARTFAIEYLGAEAGSFLSHWLTNSATTYRSLMTYFELVKEEHRAGVEMALIDNLANKKLQIKPHLDDICRSLKRYARHFSPGFEEQVHGEEHFITFMRRVYNIGRSEGLPIFLPIEYDDKALKPTLVERFCEGMSCEDKGKLLAHILIAVKEPRIILKQFLETSHDDSDGDDVVKYLSAECQKLHFEYDFTSYTSYNCPITVSFLLHLLINAPKLDTLVPERLTGTVMNDMIRECSSSGVKLKLKHLNISRNNLSDISGSLLASLFVIAPNLRYLDLRDTGLSGGILNDVIRECSSRGLRLELKDLKIGMNDLNTIDGSLLSTMLVISPKLFNLEMHSSNLSGGILNKMLRKCSKSAVNLGSLLELNISFNNLCNVDGSLLAYLLSIAPKLHILNISNCELSGVILNDMMRVCFSKRLNLKLCTLYIQYNNLGTFNNLSSLFDVAPNLSMLHIHNCDLASDIKDQVTRECTWRGIFSEV